jgi:hypothetical protein
MDVKVKICGLTNLADAQATLAGGADLLGFIFFPKSPRYVTPERVRDILAGLEPHRQVGQGGVLTVGVFVNESPQAVAQILDFCGLDLAQLHGEEPPTMLGLDDDPAEPLGEDWSPLRGRAYKALRPRPGASLCAASPASGRRSSPRLPPRCLPPPTAWRHGGDRRLAAGCIPGCPVPAAAGRRPYPG